MLALKLQLKYTLLYLKRIQSYIDARAHVHAIQLSIVFDARTYSQSSKFQTQQPHSSHR